MAVDLGQMPDEVEEVDPSSVHSLVALPAPETVISSTDPNHLSNLTASDQLSSLVDLSLERLKEILGWRVMRPETKLEVEQLKIQLSAISQTLGAQLKVDDNRLKKQSVDVLPKLLAELKEQERRQVIVDVSARHLGTQ